MVGSKIGFLVLWFASCWNTSYTLSSLYKQDEDSFTDAIWVPVIGARMKFYVYSAFLDDRVRDHPVVRVIAAVLRSEQEEVICRLTLRDSCTISVIGQIQLIHDNLESLYSAAFVLCPLLDVDPYYATSGTVSITTRNHAPGNKLTVLAIERNKREKDVIHLCVQPLHSGFNYSTERLLEWLEFNRLLGVSRFYIYNMNVSDRVYNILEQYYVKRVLHLNDWNLDMSEAEMGRPTLQLAALQDCLYRSMSAAQYLVVVDMDEIIIPRTQFTYHEFFRELRLKDPKSVKSSVYLFSNVYFYTFWPNDPYAPAPLMTARKTLRTDQALHNLTKYIVRPFEAKQLGVHDVSEFVRGAYSVYHVPEYLALLHHYRDTCASAMYPSLVGACNKMPYVIDREAQRWSKVLQSRVETKKQWFSNKILKLLN